MAERLYRSESSNVIGGVCGGLGEYFDIDPVIIRIAAVLLLLASVGSVIVAYIIAWIMIPLRPSSEPIPEKTTSETKRSGWHRYLPGLVLVAIGAVLLMRQFWWWLDWEDLFPGLLILAGVAILLASAHRKSSDSSTVDNQLAQQPNGSNGGHGQ